MMTYWGRTAWAFGPLLVVCALGGTVVGCGGAEPQNQAGAPVSAEVQVDLMARWNAVAQGVTVESWNFMWDRFADFPHPTFKGGSAEAYQAFAKVLLAFFGDGDNFDFLARNRLFKLHLIYVFPSGQTGLDTNFEDLAVFLSNSDGFPNLPAETRGALVAYVDRIKAVEAGS
jgi:hypothetical protein